MISMQSCGSCLQRTVMRMLIVLLLSLWVGGWLGGSEKLKIEQNAAQRVLVLGLSLAIYLRDVLKRKA